MPYLEEPASNIIVTNYCTKQCVDMIMQLQQYTDYSTKYSNLVVLVVNDGCHNTVHYIAIYVMDL